MAIAYWTGTGITFCLILSAFLKDGASRKVNTKAFIFIGTATLLWPVTLPFILRSKWRKAKVHYQETVVDRVLNQESEAILSTLRN